jgi:hypothetical protein
MTHPLDVNFGRISTTHSPTQPPLVLSPMILVSRPSNIPTPSPVQTLDGDLAAFLQRPYEDDAAVGHGFPIATPAPNNPETRDRLLSYAYAVYDTFVTRQLPSGLIPSEHAALLLPLLQLLYGLYPYNSPVALLLGCVYHHHNMIQRGLEINRHILRHDPDNVRSYPPLSRLSI